MKRLNLVLQGKCGVGKSFVAALLMQRYRARGLKPVAVDADPDRRTFAGYKAFDAKRIALVDGDAVNPDAFDGLVEIVGSEPEDAIVVVDVGAAAFAPLCSWMIETDAVSLLADNGVKVVPHSVLTGGPALVDTTVGLCKLCDGFDVRVVVWLNEYFGPISRDGGGFERTPVFERYRERIAALVAIVPTRGPAFDRDLERLLSTGKTFAEGAKDTDLSIISRQRLKMIWRDLDARMTDANL